MTTTSGSRVSLTVVLRWLTASSHPRRSAPPFTSLILVDPTWIYFVDQSCPSRFWRRRCNYSSGMTFVIASRTTYSARSRLYPHRVFEMVSSGLLMGRSLEGVAFAIPSRACHVFSH
ncbi:hypothetical protein AALP_AA4G122100 [Arabis alpina]|uniref:Uncharacterized protein n=1 Tax=Arabis alpina TaxID=50452 RepID=A0A087H2R9_ARAAL|nr:hypothetical protein AALP_AA4G122100 [Arabis alpina]